MASLPACRLGHLSNCLHACVIRSARPHGFVAFLARRSLPGAPYCVGLCGADMRCALSLRPFWQGPLVHDARRRGFAHKAGGFVTSLGATLGGIHLLSLRLLNTSGQGSKLAIQALGNLCHADQLWWVPLEVASPRESQPHSSGIRTILRQIAQPRCDLSWYTLMHDVNCTLPCG